MVISPSVLVTSLKYARINLGFQSTFVQEIKHKTLIKINDMNTLKLTQETNTKSNFNNFISTFSKRMKLTIRKIGREMQKHADEAGQAMRN